MPDDRALYKDTATGTVCVLASRDHRWVIMRDLNSDPRDPDGVVVVSEWGLWQVIQTGLWQRYI